MKYYLYISETKVNMLYPQIPTQLRQSLGAKIGINFGLINTEWAQEPKEKALVEKVKIVEQYIFENEDVGSVEGEHDYYYGRQDMVFGNYNNQIVFYRGYNVFLTGSAVHSIAESVTQAGTESRISGSSTAAFFKTMEVMGALDGSAINRNPFPESNREAIILDYLKQLDSYIHESSSLHDTARLEYLAKGLRTLGDKEHQVIATPIYVAYTKKK